MLSGWLFDVEQANVASAQVIGKRYFGPVDENGARKVAHEFAAEIIAKFGLQSLLGSHIYFVSDRTGHKENGTWITATTRSRSRTQQHLHDPSVSAGWN